MCFVRRHWHGGVCEGESAAARAHLPEDTEETEEFPLTYAIARGHGRGALVVENTRCVTALCHPL